MIKEKKPKKGFLEGYKTYNPETAKNQALVDINKLRVDL